MVGAVRRGALAQPNMTMSCVWSTHTTCSPCMPHERGGGREREAHISHLTLTLTSCCSASCPPAAAAASSVDAMAAAMPAPDVEGARLLRLLVVVLVSRPMGSAVGEVTCHALPAAASLYQPHTMSRAMLGAMRGSAWEGGREGGRQ